MDTPAPPVIGFLHTSPVHVPTFRALVEARDPRARTIETVDETLLDRARRQGPDDAGLLADLDDALTGLAARGADVGVCTCSTLGPAAETRNVPVEVVRIDRPMARAAVMSGRRAAGAAIGEGADGHPRIAVVAALASTLGPTGALLEEEARAAARRPRIELRLAEGAWDLFEAGDGDGYRTCVTGTARELARAGADVVVLAQASMAGAAAELAELRGPDGRPVPVLASPGPAVDEALRRARVTLRRR